MSDIEELRIIFGIAFALMVGWIVLVAKQNSLIKKSSKRKRSPRGKSSQKNRRK